VCGLNLPHRAERGPGPWTTSPERPVSLRLIGGNPYFRSFSCLRCQLPPENVPSARNSAGRSNYSPALRLVFPNRPCSLMALNAKCYCASSVPDLQQQSARTLRLARRSAVSGSLRRVDGRSKVIRRAGAALSGAPPCVWGVPARPAPCGLRLLVERHSKGAGASSAGSNRHSSRSPDDAQLGAT
jgi:hypothetical protein